jgi:hypothetical protein
MRSFGEWWSSQCIVDAHAMRDPRGRLRDEEIACDWQLTSAAASGMLCHARRLTAKLTP